MQNTLFDVSLKTILIVGASSGIGESFAHTLAQAGAKVIIAARRVDRLQKLKAVLEKTGSEIAVYAVDVTDETSVAALIKGIESDHEKIDVVINTAGINIREPFDDYAAESWRKVMDVNLNGTWFVSHAVAKLMRRKKIHGSIIHVSSVLDKRTFKVSTHSYQASKAAIVQLTKSMALELVQDNIRVNCIAPGFFLTDLNRSMLQGEKGKAIRESIPMNRSGDLHELQGVMLLLASDASSYMTGSVIRIDGGYATDHIR